MLSSGLDKHSVHIFAPRADSSNGQNGAAENDAGFTVNDPWLAKRMVNKPPYL